MALTGNGSLAESYSTRPTSCLSWSKLTSSSCDSGRPKVSVMLSRIDLTTQYEQHLPVQLCRLYSHKPTAIGRVCIPSTVLQAQLALSARKVDAWARQLVATGNNLFCPGVG